MSDLNEHHPLGFQLLQNPVFNKGTAFTEAERNALGLRGLLPPHVQTQEEQVARVLGNLRRKDSDLERYIFLIGLLDRNETLFYKTLSDHLEEMMPLVYTPVVGQACQMYAEIFRRPRGIFISKNDAGHVREVLRNWPFHDVRVIVVTDGERILGLGDLGANGMGIPVGKLSLYTTCAGIPPQCCLPVTLDVGTNNETLRNSPLYIGLNEPRLRGEAYDALIDEFLTAVRELFPRALVQFEDFANNNAFRLLKKNRDRTCCFNDDIQGTAAVALAGMLSATRITGQKFAGQKMLFLGAGEAGTGIAELAVAALVDDGMPEAEARQRCWFVDSHGLVVRTRTDLAEHKLPFAQEHAPLPDLISAIRDLKPSAIIGVSGKPNTFSREVIEEMSRINERPIIFALSNPTSQAECTADEAYRYSNGCAVFASGSPFSPVKLNGTTFVPGQGNNAYIFPGVGLGVMASESRRVTDEMFLAAARTLALEVGVNDLTQGRVYPSFERIREVSAAIAAAVAEIAYARGLAMHARPANVRAQVESLMWKPEYKSYV